MRPTSNLNAQVLSYMQVLEIEDTTIVPLMKTVRKKFLKHAKARHPDRRLGSEPDFVKLLEAKEYLFNHKRHNKPQEDKEDKEETRVSKEFKLADLEKINKDSATLTLSTAHVHAWRLVLEEKSVSTLILPVRLTPAPAQCKTKDGISITS